MQFKHWIKNNHLIHIFKIKKSILPKIFFEKKNYQHLLKK